MEEKIVGQSLQQFVAKKVPSVAVSSTMLGSPAPDAGAINEQVSSEICPFLTFAFTLSGLLPNHTEMWYLYF